MKKSYITYNQVHNNLQVISKEIEAKFKPQVIVGIGGGGYIPSRIIRTWLNIPILAVGVQLYDHNDQIHRNGPQRFQWLDDCALNHVVGKRVLIVDEVDDTRTTLHYCVKELKNAGVEEIAVLVLHNKKKKKESLNVSHYFACQEVDGECWIVYPWEADSIEDHDMHANGNESHQ